MDSHFLENKYLPLVCDKIGMSVKETQIFKLSYILEDECIVVTIVKLGLKPFIRGYMIVNNPIGLEVQSEDLTWNVREINPQNDYSFLREYAGATHVTELSSMHRKKLQCMRIYDRLDTFANITVDVINENTLEVVEEFPKWKCDDMSEFADELIKFSDFIKILDFQNITQLDYGILHVGISMNKIKYQIIDAKYWKVSKLKEKCQDLRVEFIEDSPYVKEAVDFNCDILLHEKDLNHARIYLEEHMIDIILDKSTE